MAVRGVRGATTVEVDQPEKILAATSELLRELLAVNNIDSYEEIVSIVLTTTEDLTSAFPAEAARELGMNAVPLLCASEIPVPNSMKRCIRVLLHLNTDRKQSEMLPVYLHEAKKLRPDVESRE